MGQASSTTVRMELLQNVIFERLPKMDAGDNVVVRTAKS